MPCFTRSRWRLRHQGDAARHVELPRYGFMMMTPTATIACRWRRLPIIAESMWRRRVRCAMLGRDGTYFLVVSPMARCRRSTASAGSARAHDCMLWVSTITARHHTLSRHAYNGTGAERGSKVARCRFVFITKESFDVLAINMR